MARRLTMRALERTSPAAVAGNGALTELKPNQPRLWRIIMADAPRLMGGDEARPALALNARHRPRLKLMARRLIADHGREWRA